MQITNIRLIDPVPGSKHDDLKVSGWLMCCWFSKFCPYMLQLRSAADSCVVVFLVACSRIWWHAAEHQSTQVRWCYMKLSLLSTLVSWQLSWLYCVLLFCCVSPPFMSHSMSRTRFVERAVRDLTGKRPDVAVINVMTCQLCIVSVRAVLFQTKTLCLLFLMSSSLSY